MDQLYPILDIISRIAHIGTAIVLLGGTVCLRVVIHPVLALFSEEQRLAVREQIVRNWAKLVHPGIALLLITGFYNFFRLMSAHKGQPVWHALIGTKIILAFIIFFLASVLVGRSPGLAKLREKSPTLMLIVILLGFIIVAISGYAKVALKAVS